jgi:hypothetical protein
MRQRLTVLRLSPSPGFRAFEGLTAWHVRYLGVFLLASFVSLFSPESLAPDTEPFVWLIDSSADRASTLDYRI